MNARDEAEAPVVAPERWERLGGSTWLTPGTGVGMTVAVYLAFRVGAAAGSSVDRPSPLVSVLVGLLVAGVLVALVVAVQKWRFQPPSADFDRGLVRSGRRTIFMADLEWARLLVQVGRHGRSRSLHLVLGSGRSAQLVFVLRDRRDRVMAKDHAQALAEVIRRSSVRMPTSGYDPDGRFAHANFPTNISRDEAITLVLDPPGRTSSLPIPDSTWIEQRPRRGPGRVTPPA